MSNRRGGIILVSVVTALASARAADAKIDFKTSDPNYQSAFWAAWDAIKQCDDCKHNQQFKDMISWIESDKTKTFYIQDAPPAEILGDLIPVNDGCIVSNSRYKPGQLQDVDVYWSPEPIAYDSFDSCPTGQTNPVNAGNFSPAVTLAHELAHCYFRSIGRKLTNQLSEQFRAIFFENMLRRCKDVQQRVCTETYSLIGQVQYWPYNGTNSQNIIVDNCECSPSGLNGTSDCTTVVGSGGECCNFFCKNLQRDNDNCGQCGNPCGGTINQCCSGTCTDTSTSASNCGLCGYPCTPPKTCTASTCKCDCGQCQGYQCNGVCGVVNGVCCWTDATDQNCLSP